MPIATLKFNLPEEKDEFQQAVNVGKYISVLWDLDQMHLRPITKHNIVESSLREEIKKDLKEHFEFRQLPVPVLDEETIDTVVIATIEMVRTKLYELLNEEGVTIC